MKSIQEDTDIMEEYRDCGCLGRSYWAVNQQPEKLRDSSSGAVFCELAEAMIDRGGVVFGARYDKTRRRVYHCGVNEKKEIPDIMKSKYVKSNITDSLGQARNYLNEGREVLYSGTPCQVYAARRFLRDTDSKRLYTVSFFCHGVPEAKLWSDYIEYLEGLFSASVETVDFRFKTGVTHNLFLHIIFENGKEYFAPYDCDPYYSAFSNKVSLIRACHHCMFKGSRPEDITLGDCQPREVQGEIPYSYPSIVVANNEKGQRLLEEELFLSLNKNVELKELKKRYDPESAIPEEEREAFFRLYQQEGMRGVAREFYEKERRKRIWKTDYDPNKKSIVAGAGVYGKLAAFFIGRDQIACYADNDPGKAGYHLDGIQVLSVQDLKKNMDLKAYNVIVGVSRKYIEEMICSLEEQGVEEYTVLVDLMRSGRLKTG